MELELVVAKLVMELEIVAMELPIMELELLVDLAVELVFIDFVVAVASFARAPATARGASREAVSQDAL
eukprot:5570821-Pyramimonas_sp.AAC.1